MPMELIETDRVTIHYQCCKCKKVIQTPLTQDFLPASVCGECNTLENFLEKIGVTIEEEDLVRKGVFDRLMGQIEYWESSSIVHDQESLEGVDTELLKMSLKIAGRVMKTLILFVEIVNGVLSGREEDT